MPNFFNSDSTSASGDISAMLIQQQLEHSRHKLWLSEKYEQIVNATIERAFGVLRDDVEQVVADAGDEEDAVQERAATVHKRNIERLERFQVLWKQNIHQLVNSRQNSHQEKKQEKPDGNKMNANVAKKGRTTRKQQQTMQMMMPSNQFKNEDQNDIVEDENNCFNVENDCTPTFDPTHLLPPSGLRDICSSDPHLSLILEKLNPSSSSSSSISPEFERRRQEVKQLLEKPLFVSTLNNNHEHEQQHRHNKNLNTTSSSSALHLLPVDDPVRSVEKNNSTQRRALLESMISLNEADTVADVIARGDFDDPAISWTLEGRPQWNIDLREDMEDDDAFINETCWIDWNNIDEWLRSFHRSQQSTNMEAKGAMHDEHVSDVKILHVNGVSWGTDNNPIGGLESVVGIDHDLKNLPDRYRPLCHTVFRRVMTAGHCFVKIPNDQGRKVSDQQKEGVTKRRSRSKVEVRTEEVQESHEEFFARFDMMLPLLMFKAF